MPHHGAKEFLGVIVPLAVVPLLIPVGPEALVNKGQHVLSPAKLRHLAKCAVGQCTVATLPEGN
jgi:hypothetical protein